MFPSDVLLAYLAAVILIVLAPGPDNILAMSRGLSQGPIAAALSSLGAGLGIMAHSTATTLGLALVLHASPVAFVVVKAAGAIYLLWLGVKAIAARKLISFVPAERQPLGQIFLTGLLSNLLNPKPGLFVVTFIPQFVSASRGSVPAQMLVLGAIFAIVTAMVFTVLGAFASQLANWLQRRPRVVFGLNLGAGITFIAAGLSILTLPRKA